MSSSRYAGLSGYPPPSIFAASRRRFVSSPASATAGRCQGCPSICSCRALFRAPFTENGDGYLQARDLPLPGLERRVGNLAYPRGESGIQRTPRAGPCAPPDPPPLPPGNGPGVRAGERAPAFAPRVSPARRGRRATSPGSTRTSTPSCWREASTSRKGSFICLFSMSPSSLSTSATARSPLNGRLAQSMLDGYTGKQMIGASARMRRRLKETSSGSPARSGA